METGLRADPGPVRLESMRLAAIAVLTLTAVGLSGCVAVNTTQGGGGRAQLVSDLASRLIRADELTYTAVYRLPQGVTATVSQAQDPGRAAYRYDGGKLTLTPQYLADCRTGVGGTTCTLTPPPSPGSDPATALIAEVADRGLVVSTTVIALLTAAAVDPEAVVTTRDTTIAGENATCVQVRGVQHAAASDFEVCVTTEGLLGSFTGLVATANIDIRLDRFEQTVAPDAFDLPAGARIVDQRPK